MCTYLLHLTGENWDSNCSFWWRMQTAGTQFTSPTPVVYFSCDRVCPATLPTQKPLLQSNISSRTSSRSVFTEQKRSWCEEVGWGFIPVADLSRRLGNSEEGLSLIMPDIRQGNSANGFAIANATKLGYIRRLRLSLTSLRWEKAWGKVDTLHHTPLVWISPYAKSA